MRAYFCEAVGTFLLVLIGTFVIMQAAGSVLVISLGFGVTLMCIILLFGTCSGAHVNPAVSLGAWCAGALSTYDIVPYILAQLFGAAFASVLIAFLTEGTLGETTFVLPMQQAFLLEMVLTFLFVSVILRSAKYAAVFIGATLFLIHMIAVPLTGASVNPARSIGPVVAGADPLAASQIWLYITAPLLGGAIAGLVKKFSR